MENKIVKSGLDTITLTIGQRAKCEAGYPKKGTVVIEAIVDFSNAGDDIIDTPSKYFKVIDNGKFGLLTSHMISNYWEVL